MEFESIIGLEVHAQLRTKTKIFCSCQASFGLNPNLKVCPICSGMPGVLPVLNKDVLNFALKTSLALNCKINEISRFARKNYFYPDLPKGYQISQYEEPLAVNGFIEIETNVERKKIRITRVHMEEDAGKLIHSDENVGESLVDFNRCSVPLIEIVSEPDIRTSEEAVNYLKSLRNILVYLDVCDGNMEEGSLRCDANISVREIGAEKFGVKTEIKNMNSFKNVKDALEYEIKRQIELLEGNDVVVQETRLWDPKMHETISMRSKEEAHDYRYFPEPDLVALKIDENYIIKIKAEIPELPFKRKERFINDYNLPILDADVLTSSKNLADFYEECVKIYDKPKTISNWIMTELLRELNASGIGIERSPVSPQSLTSLIKFIDDGEISGKMAKEIFAKMYESGNSAKEIIEREGLKQVTDIKAIEEVVDEVIAKNEAQLKNYLKGREGLFGFFMGEAMKITKGKANPEKVRDIMKKRLEEIKKGGVKND